MTNQPLYKKIVLIKMQMKYIYLCLIAYCSKTALTQLATCYSNKKNYSCILLLE